MSNRSNYYKLIFEKFGKPDSKIQSQLPRETQQQSLVIADSQNDEEILDIQLIKQMLKLAFTLNYFKYFWNINLIYKYSSLF